MKAEDKILYRNRKGRVLHYDPWNFDTEAGDILVDTATGTAYRAEENCSLQTRDAGILYPRKLKPPRPGMMPIIENGKMYWVTPAGRAALDEEVNP